MILLLFDISGGELLVILVVAFLVFGPRRMPEIARHIGKGMNDLKKVTSDLTRELRDGTAEIRKEIIQEKDKIVADGRRLKEEMLSGPSDFGTEVVDHTVTPRPGSPGDPAQTPGSPATSEDPPPDGSDTSSAGQPAA